jgi:CheY-like chemotaxis protein
VIAGVELVRAVGALRLRVETRAVEEPVAGPRRTLAPGTWAVLQLRAEGAPPAPHRLATLLDPASSGRPSVGSLVHAAAGTVTTRVSADATEVTCWLPLAASASRAAPPPARGPAHLAAAVVAARRPASLAPATPRVLVVDDEDGIRAATCALLRRHGFVVHAAASARAALTLLEREPVDLVLTDVAMPDMTGPDLAREVAARDLAPVLFMSGLSREELRRKGWVDGDQVVVAKPFASGDLIAAVEAALRPPG